MTGQHKDAHEGGPMIAAIYARKSTDQNGVAAEDRSVTRQIDHARAYAVGKGWVVADEHIYSDDGISGAEFAKRPGFLRLMNALKPRPRFDVLIMSEESRLGREQIETAYALKQIITAGVRVFYTLDEQERTLDSPTDKILQSLTAFADELEREKARQRTYDAMRRKAQAGHVTGGRVFGYDNVRAVGGPVTRDINEAEAAVVRDIFTLYSRGHGLRQIAHQLNEVGARCPRAQQGRPYGWAPSSVREVLYRPLYRGEIVWNRTRKRNRWGQVSQQNRPESDWLTRPAPELRIVPEGLSKAVDARLTSNKTRYLRTTGGRLWGRPRSGVDSKYLLVGFATCGTCGGGVSVSSRKHGTRRAFYYVCTAHHTRGRSVCPNGHDVPMVGANEALLEAVREQILSPEVVTAAVARAAERIAALADNPPDTGEIRGQLADLDRELSHLTEALAAGGDVPSVVAAIQERDKRRGSLLAQLTALERVAHLPTLDLTRLERDLTTRLTEWRGLLSRHTAQARQLLRKLLVGRLTFVPENRADGRYVQITGTGTIGPIAAALGFPNTVASLTGPELNFSLPSLNEVVWWLQRLETLEKTGQYRVA